MVVEMAESFDLAYKVRLCPVQPGRPLLLKTHLHLAVTHSHPPLPFGSAAVVSCSELVPEHAGMRLALHLACHSAVWAASLDLTCGEEGEQLEGNPCLPFLIFQAHSVRSVFLALTWAPSRPSLSQD